MCWKHILIKKGSCWSLEPTVTISQWFWHNPWIKIFRSMWQVSFPFLRVPDLFVSLHWSPPKASCLLSYGSYRKIALWEGWSTVLGKAFRETYQVERGDDWGNSFGKILSFNETCRVTTCFIFSWSSIFSFSLHLSCVLGTIPSEEDAGWSHVRPKLVAGIEVAFPPTYLSRARTSHFQAQP